MSYQALARKWRPRRFSELVGQEHVVRALSHALERQTLHHALLFSGTRGVGKTTLGRIIAKCLNCERGMTAEPCGPDSPCSACAEIDEGRFVDLIEVDAASRTGVDDTRELMDNVQYAPARGRYKVYLIDEVHMLSKHAFNALLKTLEEPPGHVQFLLATTDPQKIPVTILSRCLQFPLKRLARRDITAQLQTIVAQEGLEADTAALEAISRGADGSMRDALSLLDQAIAFGGDALRADEVADMLGDVSQAVLYRMLEAVAAGDAGGLLEAIGQLDERAPDYAQVLDALAGVLHRVAVLQLVPGALPEDADELAPLSEAMTPEDVQLFYDIALAGRRDLDWAPDPRSGVEMTCLRMLAFRPASAARPGADRQARPRVPSPAADAAPAAAVEPDAAAADASASDWDALVARLSVKGMTAELARNCTCLALDTRQVRLELPQRLQHLLTDKGREQLRAALQEALGAEARVEIRVGEGAGDSPAERAASRDAEKQEQARRAIADDPNVQALRTKLGAQVRDDSIRPEDD